MDFLVTNSRPVKVLKNNLFFLRFFESLQRRTYITPTSYLELIKTFKKLLEKKRFDLLSLKNRYIIGLEKLANTEDSINEMKSYLIEKQPVLEKHQEVSINVI